MTDNNPEFGTLREIFFEWNISDSITKKFIDNGITLQLLKFLTDEDFAELCPHVSTRMSLKKQIKNLVLPNQQLLMSSSSSNKNTLQPPNISSTTGDYSFLECPLCHKTETTIKQHILHLIEIHKKCGFPCPVKDCYRLYDTKYSLQHHYNHSHNDNSSINQSLSSSNNNTILLNNDLLHAEFNQTISNNSASSCNTSPSDINNLKTDIEDPIVHESRNNSSRESNYYFSEINKFISHMYNFLNMPRSLIQSLFKMVETFTLNLLSSILKSLNNSDMTFDDRVNNISSIYIEIKNAFTQLGTEYRRIQHYQNSECYVEPVSDIVGVHKKDRKINNKKIMSLIEAKSYIVPLKRSLKLFSELPEVFITIYDYQKQLIEENKNNTDKILRNVVQGTLWSDLMKQKGTEDIILPLIVFYDDLETGNPPGSHSGINKLGAIYTSIATVPPNMSSRLENIFLTQLFYSADRTKFGNKSIFKKLVIDLKELEEIGINICVNDEKINVKFVLATLAGDNLRINSILGFPESFNATYFCRICLTTKADSENQTRENETLIRKVTDYDKHIKDGHIEDKVNLKEVCVWNDLPSYHVYNNWSFDVMHDLMEGIHRYSMALIINDLIQNKKFTLDQLNSRIKYFLYNVSEATPPAINVNHLKSKYIIMSASEMLSLVRNFGFIVGDLVEDDNDTWIYYNLLLKITEILTSQTFSHELLEYLQNLIYEHYERFIRLFNEKLKPKYHLLLHYPKIIMTIGPPILVSSFKYEAKHRDVKIISDSISCKIQLPFSVATRSQLKSCFRFSSKIGFYDAISYSKYTRKEENDFNNFYVDWYQINGITFKIGMAVTHNFDESNEPVFYEINDISVNVDNEKIAMLDCTSLKILQYNTHFKAYNIMKTANRKKILLDKCSSQSLMIRNINNNLFVSISKL